MGVRFAAKKKPGGTYSPQVFQLPFLDFIERVSPQLSRPSHLRNIVNFFEAVDRGEVLREADHAPVQHGKSTTIFHGLAWLLGRHPDWPIIYATYSHQFSAANSREVRRIYTDCGGPIQDDFNTIQEWHTGKGGFLLATSPDGSGTGKPARVFVVDDPFKNRADAESPEVRELVRTWFRSVAMSRQSSKSSYAVIASRYHEEDLSGFVSAPRPNGLGFAYNRLAGINDDGEDPLREIGAPLCPNGPDPEAPRDLAFLEALRTDLGDYEFEALVQGRPRPPSGSLFRGVTYANEWPAPGTVRAFGFGVDLAYSKSRTSDSTAVVLLALLLDGTVVVCDVDVWQKEIADSENEFRRNFAKQPTALACAYVSGNEMGHIETLMRADPPIVIYPLPARYSKAFRAVSSSRAWNAGRIKVLRDQPWTSRFVSRVISFDGREGGKDDEVDGMVAGFDMLCGTAATVAPGPTALYGRRRV